MSQLRLNKYGWKADKPDIRDMKFSAPRQLIGELPRLVDMRSRFPKPYDQGDLGICTGMSIAGLLHFNYLKNNPATAFQPSPLFIYYNERVLENTVNEDAGAELRSGIKSLTRWGVCPEQYHPFIISKFKSKPSKLAYKNALPHRISQYSRIRQTENDLKACLAEDSPFVFGFMVYSYFESDEMKTTGILKVPHDERALGGHAVLAVGFDDDRRCFIVRNSWGCEWGIEGYFYMPYDYILNEDLSADFWTIKL